MNHDHDKTIRAAFDVGYSDAMNDEYDTRSLPCRCNECLKAYDKGQEAAEAKRLVTA